MGLPINEDRLSIGLTVPEIYASQKRDHGRPDDEILGLQCRFDRNSAQSIYVEVYEEK